MATPSRLETEQGILARAGFLDPTRAEKLLGDPILGGVDHDWLLGHLAQVGEPGEGLVAFIRLREAAQREGKYALEALDHVLSQDSAARRLFAVLGFSHPLTDQLVKNPGYVHILSDEKVGSEPFATSLAGERESALAAVHARYQGVPGSDRAQPVSQMDERDGVNALRAHYWYRIAQVAASDLIAPDAPAAMPEVSGAITDIVCGALEAALAVARAHVTDGNRVGLVIIAMGKTGARELNYISDVDVVYAARALDPELAEDEMIRIATELASFVARAVSAPGEQMALWPLDANLRPEGKDGPLVRTLESHLAYYKRWAKDWEFQALLKARPVAGDLELGEQYMAAMGPMVWSAAGRENFVEDSRAMRRRVEDHVPAKEAPRQLKLGKGGLRDVEFTVQLLQLVHGRTDSSLHVRNTLKGIAALAAQGYISRTHGEELARDYQFLRTLEHRIQLQKFRRSHVVPKPGPELRRIARTMHGCSVTTSEALEELWQRTRTEVRDLHLAIYYRPLLPQMAKLSEHDISLDEDAAKARLAAIGYRDPMGDIAHIKALTGGISRTSSIQKHLLPVMLGWFAAGPEPDHGLRAFRVLSETMGKTSWYMRLLRDSSVVAERLAYVLSTSRYVAAELPKLPEAMSWLDDDAQLYPRTTEELSAELDSLVSRRKTGKDVALAGRYLRRRELLRTALADVILHQPIATSASAISAAGGGAVVAALRGAVMDAREEFGIAGGDPDPARIACIAMGRFGGAELNYASDADVLFVYEPQPDADPLVAENFSIAVAKLAMSFLSQPDAEPSFVLDADLRPEGKNGPLARSLESYREYYERWVETWERQALLRARFVAGDTHVGEAFIELIDPLRYPAEGLSDGHVREVRAMKARVERERVPRGVDPSRHLKLGRGTLSDVEWCAQLLQLRYAGQVSALRTPSTLGALQAGAEAGLITEEDYERLRDSWQLASQVRNANVLATGRTSGAKIDVFPRTGEERAVVVALLGLENENGHEFEDRYLRLARHARTVVEDVFYGLK